MNDVEYYTRLIQDILDEGVDRQYKLIHPPDTEGLDDIEAELVSRVKHDARQLAESYGRLVQWLRETPGRRAGKMALARPNRGRPTR